jgi:hypothetical protein
MTDMRPAALKVFGPRFMLATLLATFATFAQEADDLDSLEPAVDTSAVAEEEQEEQEDLQPAVLLATDVTRQENGGAVMDRLDLGRTEITGNSELPTVMYIVPWQKSDPGDLMGRPVNTLLDEVLAPIDREEFLRQVDYYGDLYEDDEQE